MKDCLEPFCEAAAVPRCACPACRRRRSSDLLRALRAFYLGRCPGAAARPSC